MKQKKLRLLPKIKLQMPWLFYTIHNFFNIYLHYLNHKTISNTMDLGIASSSNITKNFKIPSTNQDMLYQENSNYNKRQPLRGQTTSIDYNILDIF